MENNKRNIRSNKNQIKYLIDYMLHRKYFAIGDCRTSFEIKQYNEEWRSLKEALNELGPQRSVEQWKTCWRDQKRRARMEGALVTQARKDETNNSTETPCLSEDVVKILSSIGHEIPVKIEESPIGSGEDSINISLPVAPPSGIATRRSDRLYKTTSAAPSRPPKRRKVLPSRTVVPSKMVLPSTFVNAQVELNQLVKDLISEVREGNMLKRELLSEMKQQNVNLMNLPNSSTATIEIKQERDVD